MLDSDKKYRGFSLLELLVAIAIIGVLIGIVLSAIHRVRVEAVKTASMNNLRQIILGVHQLADQRAGELRGLIKADLPKKPEYTEQSIFYAILPWTYGPRQLDIGPNANPTSIQNYFHPSVSVYLSPGDPSFNSNSAAASSHSKCSYSCNIMAFDGHVLFPFTLPDGMTSTLAFTENYFFCGATQEFRMYNAWYGPSPPHMIGGDRRASFADKAWHDILPVTDPNTKRTVASVPGNTFQVRPRVEEASSNLPQTPYASGLPVALFDGSVRTLSPRIEEHVFWALVTPNGGEVIGDY